MSNIFHHPAMFVLVNTMFSENKALNVYFNRFSIFFNKSAKISSVCKNYYIINYQHNIQNKVLKSYILSRRNYYIWHSRLPNCLVSCKNFEINIYTLKKRVVVTYYITIRLNITNTTIYKAVNHHCDQLKVFKCL